MLESVAEVSCKFMRKNFRHQAECSQLSNSLEPFFVFSLLRFVFFFYPCYLFINISHFAEFFPCLRQQTDDFIAFYPEFLLFFQSYNLSSSCKVADSQLYERTELIECEAVFNQSFSFFFILY